MSKTDLLKQIFYRFHQDYNNRMETDSTLALGSVLSCMLEIENISRRLYEHVHGTTIDDLIDEFQDYLFHYPQLIEEITKLPKPDEVTEFINKLKG